MQIKSFKKVQIGVSFFMGATVAVAVLIDNLFLALTAVLAGMIFMFLVKRKVKGVMVDERIISLAGKAARITYGIVTMVLAIASLIFVVLGKANGEFYLESLGIIFSYITLFSMAVYSISYRYLSRKQ